MSNSSLPATIELDGVTELFRCSNFRIGWSAADIRVTYSPGTWRLPERFDHLLEEWEKLHPNERNDPKVALRRVCLDSKNKLVCQLQSTEWREVRPLHETQGVNEKTSFRRQTDGCEMLMPNIGVVHVIVATSDGWLLLLRRSDSVHYHPGSWTATYEEGLAPEDIGDDMVFQRAARRGLAEELIAEAGTTSLDAFRVLSLILERPISNPAFVVMASLPFSLRDLRAHTPSDEFDAKSIVTVPIDQVSIRNVITTPATVLGTSPICWHPTARYRLLVALAYFYGEEVMAEALLQIQPDSDS